MRCSLRSFGEKTLVSWSWPGLERSLHRTSSSTNMAIGLRGGGYLTVHKSQRYGVGVGPSEPLVAALVAGHNFKSLRATGRSGRGTS